MTFQLNLSLFCINWLIAITFKRKKSISLLYSVNRLMKLSAFNNLLLSERCYSDWRQQLLLILKLTPCVNILSP